MKGQGRAPGAESQLRAGRDLLSKAGQGKTRIRLEANGKNITEDIDLASVDTSTESATGPAGKKDFTRSLGITADDLAALIEDLTRQAVAARTGPTK
jgi:hypothetical protein